MGKIKFKILDIFFKNELKEYDEAIERIKRKAEKETQRIQYEANKKNAMLDVSISALKENGHIIVGYEKNKSDDEVFVVQWTYSDNIWFMLYSTKYRAINNHPRIMATIKRPYDKDAYIHIDDVLVEDNNVGNGSILMPYFINHCRKTDAKYIKGQLSDVDSEHFDRSESFYKKHGFIVTLNKDRTSGGIRLDF